MPRKMLREPAWEMRNSFAAMQAAFAQYPVAGVMLELVQSEDGMKALDADYVQALCALCREKDALLIVDEVQTGNGRTGALYAYELFGIAPDVVTTANGLAGGLPIGVTLIGARAAGTLTRGTFAVTAVHPAQPELSDQALLQLAAAAEQFSDHPVSQSLRRAAGELPADLVTTDAKELAGHGVTAQVGGRSVAAGNTKLMDTLGLTVPAVNETGTVIHVAADGAYLGYIVISDEPKTGSREAVARLRADGVRVVMLTGDRKSAADAVAEELGIAEVHSELLPEDKVTQVERLLGEGAPGKYLAFVGDGINDAPVLARADLGAAMGGIGSDAAIEAADIVLMDDDPRKLSLAMRISRKTMRLVWENIVFALAVKAVCLVLGALGIANMWVAIFADVGVMVLCVLNAARALNTKHL